MNAMTKLATIAAGFPACGLPLFAQLTLNQGDIFTHQFSSLPYFGFRDLNPSLGEAPTARFTFSILPETFQNGEVVRFEMFENSVFDTPLCSGELSAVPPEFGTCTAVGAWQDLQGSIRLTMLSGSVTVDDIGLLAETVRPGVPVRPDFLPVDGWVIYFVPVPEPGAWALLSLGLLAIFHRLRRQA
jgi:hypothetical protein